MRSQVLYRAAQAPAFLLVLSCLPPFLLSPVASLDVQSADSRPSCEACLCCAESVYNVSCVQMLDLSCLPSWPCHCRFCYICPAIFVLVNTVTSADCVLLRCHTLTVTILKCFWQPANLFWLQPCFAAHYSTDSPPLHNHSSRLWSP